MKTGHWLGPHPKPMDSELHWKKHLYVATIDPGDTKYDSSDAILWPAF